MADNTAELPDVRAQLEQVAEMTSVLPQMDRRMASLGHLHESLEPLGRLADRIPGGSRR